MCKYMFKYMLIFVAYGEEGHKTCRCDLIKDRISKYK